MRHDNKEMLDTLQSVELGEGVEIRLRIAGPFSRGLALVIDTFIILLIMVVVLFIAGLIESVTNDNIGYGIRLLFAFFISWGYFTLLESGRHGATYGKRMMGLRVTDRSGNNATRSQIFVRNILRLVDMLPGIPTTAFGVLIGSFGLGCFCCLFTKKFQRIGDLVANTVVVYTQPEMIISGQEPNVEHAVAPTVAMTREEQVALVEYYQRAGLWSQARRIELADHAEKLTREKGMGGMVKLLSMAKWIKEKG